MKQQRSLFFLLGLAYCAGQAAAQHPITMIGRRGYMLPGTRSRWWRLILMATGGRI
jgi:hypothetical protein